MHRFIYSLCLAMLISVGLAFADNPGNPQTQAASTGEDIRYDVVTGTLDDLRSSATFASAACLADDVSTVAYQDGRVGPDPGQRGYYLVLGDNSCGAGSYGDARSSPDRRDDLDSGRLCASLESFDAVEH